MSSSNHNKKTIKSEDIKKMSPKKLNKLVKKIPPKFFDDTAKKDFGNEIIKKMPPKILDEIYKKIPEQNFKAVINNSFKLAMCGFSKCTTEMANLNKIKQTKDIKIANLIKKLQEGKITKEKFELQTLQINRTFQISQENFKFIECALSNCVEFMKKQLLLGIDNLKIKFKDDKEKLDKLKNYNKLFNKTKIDIKDVKNFYIEFISKK